jgi:hypothetical protein
MLSRTSSTGETKAAYRRSDVLAKRRRIEEWTAFCTSGELTPALSPCPDSLRFKADGQKNPCQHRTYWQGPTNHPLSAGLENYRLISGRCVTGSCSRAPRSGIEAIRASVTAGALLLSETITLACCVTLPTMALPPSPTDTFCTVMAGSLLLR